MLIGKMWIRRGSLQQLVIVTIKIFYAETGPTLYAWPWKHHLTLMLCSEAPGFPESVSADRSSDNNEVAYTHLVVVVYM